LTMSKTVAVIGGTGNLGAALAGRWAKAGIKIVIGSRDAARAQAAADDIGHGAVGAANAEAATLADIVVLAVPFASQESTVADIRDAVQGKIVIDTTVPLVPPKVMRVQLPPEGSAAVRTKSLLGDGVTLMSAFHSVAAQKLATDEVVDCDVLVFGDDKAARQIGIDLAAAAGLRGLHGGALVNSAAAEALTSILIFLNKTYKVDGAGVRITGELIAPES
jgi:8-hydroxy-5-deazaflavin:NADPH oxidoreductase